MTGKNLLMIHGMWGSAWHWDNYKSFFEKNGYDCLVPVLRYHDIEPGTQPDPRLGRTSLLDYADDLEQLAGELPNKPVIIGHSMGGLLAQILAARGLAELLVLLCPAAPAGIFSITTSVARAFWSIQTKWGFWKKPNRQTFQEAVFSLLHNLDPEEQKKTFARGVYESGRAAAEIGYWFFDPHHASRVDETGISCPILIISGGQDRITPPVITRKIYRKYKHTAEYKEFPSHSHWVIAEPGWQRIAEYILNWLNGKIGGKP